MKKNSTNYDNSVNTNIEPKENRVSIKIEIIGDKASDIAQELVTLAFMLAPNLRPGANNPAPAGDTVVETVTPARKPGRPKKGETIEGEVSKETPKGEPADEKPADTVVDQSAGGNAAATVAADAATTNEAAKPADKSMSIDDLRKFIVATYLTGHFDGLDAQKAEFTDLLSKFNVAKIGDLPTDKIAEMKKLVDERIAAKELEKVAA